MIQLPNDNISVDLVRATLSEPTTSINGLCNSPNINRWAKYSPLTRNGEHIPYTCYPASLPFECQMWEYNPITSDGSHLGDFRNYLHSAVKPVFSGFPDKLYSNINNIFAIGTSIGEGPYISLNDVYNSTNKYFGVAIRRVDDHSKMIWGTDASKGSTSVSVDLSKFSAYFGSSRRVECIMFYSSSNKPFDAPDLITDFYSIKCDLTVIDRKEYTIQTYTPPSPYDEFRLIVEPNGGNWSYDVVQFDRLAIELKSVATTTYYHNLRIITPDGRYSIDGWRPQQVTIQAGQRGVTCDIDNMELIFWSDYNLVFVQALDLSVSTTNPKVLAEIPVMKFIEHSLSAMNKFQKIKY